MAAWTNYGRYEIAILGVSEPPSPIDLATWTECAKRLDPYFAKPRKSAARVELWTGKARRVPMGRVAWSHESFAMWCEHPKRRAPGYFQWFDAVTPPWPDCKRRKEAPDAYFHMARGISRNPWSHQLLLGVRDDVELPSALDTARSLVALGLNAVSLHRVVGPFAEPGIRRRGGGDGMSNAMVDWHGSPPTGGPWKSRKVRV